MAEQIFEIIISAAVTAFTYGAGPFILCKFRKRSLKLLYLRIFCVSYSAIIWLIWQFLTYDGTSVRTMPAVFWGYISYRLAKKSMQKKPASFTPAIPAQETPVERWYTCPKCGQLVREGEGCDCEEVWAKAREQSGTPNKLEAQAGALPTPTPKPPKAEINPPDSPSKTFLTKENIRIVSLLVVFLVALYVAFDYDSPKVSSDPSVSPNTSSQTPTESKPFNIRKKGDSPEAKKPKGGLTITQIETGKTWSSKSNPDAGLSAVPIHNEEIIIEPDEEGLAPLTIETRGTEKYYVHLKPLGYEGSEMSFYVIGGQTAEVLVPLGYYELYYATGVTWYGLENLFGSKTERFKCDDTFDFYEEDGYYQGWTITLYKVSNGNMSTQEVSAEDFPI